MDILSVIVGVVVGYLAPKLRKLVKRTKNTVDDRAAEVLIDNAPAIVDAVVKVVDKPDVKTETQAVTGFRPKARDHRDGEGN